LGRWDPFFPKALGQPRKVKNDPIMLKFGILVDWMNLRELFYFLKIFLFGPLGPVFFYIFVYVLKLWGSLGMSKMA